MKISIVIPCYNEESCINEYYKAMRPIREKLGTEFEYIFVDDGSTDRTLELIKDIAANDKEVRFISFSRNFGKEAAIYAGLKNASGDCVGLMDADLQDPPEMLLDMYKGIVEEGYDCVGCRRTDRKGESKVRSAFARFFYRLMKKMSDVEVVDGARDFRLMSRKMTDAVLEISERERFSKGIFGWVGFKTKYLEYKNTERIAGTTKWNFKNLSKYAVSGIEDFSTAPLKFNFVFALTMLLSAVAFAVFDIVWACTGHNVSLLFILLPIICFISSMLGVGLMLIGEYTKKIFKEVKARPIYIVRETDKDMPRTEYNIKITCEEEQFKDAK